MSMTIALSDVLSGTDQGIVLGTGPDGAPSILAWRPQILGVQAPPVALHGSPTPWPGPMVAPAGWWRCCRRC
jgi:hypothetical protein